MNGFAGKILRIDLTTGDIAARPLPAEDVLRSYIGCLGLGLRVLYDDLPPGYDAVVISSHSRRTTVLEKDGYTNGIHSAYIHVLTSKIYFVHHVVRTGDRVVLLIQDCSGFGSSRFLIDSERNKLHSAGATKKEMNLFHSKWRSHRSKCGRGFLTS